MDHGTKTDWRVETLRISFGIIMVWFGILKLMDPTGPAESLAERTVRFFTGGRIHSDAAVYLIAGLEILIGIGILIRKWLRYVIPVLLFHMAGTAAPLLLFPAETWSGVLQPTFEGQYILKNIILVGAALVLTIIPYGSNVMKSSRTDL